MFPDPVELIGSDRSRFLPQEKSDTYLLESFSLNYVLNQEPTSVKHQENLGLRGNSHASGSVKLYLGTALQVVTVHPERKMNVQSEYHGKSIQ